MSSMTVEMTEPDRFGQSHPLENPNLIEAKLNELEVELGKIQEKSAYDQATSKCPDQVKSSKLVFLRCEVFNADLAALRLTKYWEKRLEIFGPEKAFLPLSQEGLFDGTKDVIEHGFVTALPGVKDPDGRGVVLVDPSKIDSSKFERVQVVRGFWYSIHAILEEESTQKRGIIALVCPRNAKLTQFDSKLDQMVMECIKGCLPVRMSCIAICHPPSFFRIIWPIARVMMGARLRKRVKVFMGKNEDVINKVESIGLTKDQIPELIGGNFMIDRKAWLEGRKQMGK